jgi:hypothetical protein
VSRPLAMSHTRTTSLCLAVITAVSLLLSVGCARPPTTAYTFDTAPGGWELGGHRSAGGSTSEVYTHTVHNEHLEVFEITTAAPGTSSSEFTALPAPRRVLPTLGETTTTMRALGDDELSGTQGYWVAQYGRNGREQLQAAAFVVPSGNRHFVVRLVSSEDEVEQLRGWLRDTVLRNFRFPAPRR